MDEEHFTTDSADQQSDPHHDRAVVTAESEGGAEILRFALGNTTLRQAIKRAEFNYDALDAVTAMKLRQAVIDASEAQSDLITAVVRIGNCLIGAKDLVAPGTFLAWAASELGVTARTAENYMNSARFLVGDTKCISHSLPAHLIYKLAGPNTPPEIVQDVVAAVKAGAPLPVKEVAGRIADAFERRLEERQKIERITARTSKSSIRRRKDEQREREDRALKQEKAERLTRLAPLVERVILALGDELLPQVLEALGDWQDRADFIDLLRRAPDGAA
jgi:hypothetical protein